MSVSLRTGLSNHEQNRSSFDRLRTSGCTGASSGALVKCQVLTSFSSLSALARHNSGVTWPDAGTRALSAERCERRRSQCVTKRALFPSMVCALAVGLSIFTSPSPRAEEPVSFVKDIQPIFEKSCWTCHSQTLQLSKLDLSSRDSALKGGEHGPALVPGTGRRQQAVPPDRRAREARDAARRYSAHERADCGGQDLDR